MARDSLGLGKRWATMKALPAFRGYLVRSRFTNIYLRVSARSFASIGLVFLLIPELLEPILDHANPDRR
jgi:hypothetical protein